MNFGTTLTNVLASSLDVGCWPNADLHLAKLSVSNMIRKVIDRSLIAGAYSYAKGGGLNVSEYA